MEKINLWQSRISYLLASIVLVVAYEVKNEVIPLPKSGIDQLDKVLPAVLAVLLFMFSLQIGRKLGRFLISKMWLRARILGDNHVEGFWYIETYSIEENGNDENKNGDESKSVFLSPGILWLRYEPSVNQFCVNTMRLSLEDELYEFPSKIVDMKEEGSLLLYVNYFVVFPRTGHYHEHEGFSKGYFYKSSSGEKIKDKFAAYIFSQKESTLRQVAYRIPKEKVERYKKQVQEEAERWEEKFIKDHKRS